MRGIVQPARGAAGMRKWDEDAVAIAAHATDGVFQGDLPPEPFDRELPEEQQDRWTHDGDLADEPRRAVRDLGWTRLAIARATRGLPGKTLRDRAPVRQMVLAD